jgi:hypothetical protein
MSKAYGLELDAYWTIVVLPVPTLISLIADGS